MSFLTQASVCTDDCIPPVQHRQVSGPVLSIRLKDKLCEVNMECLGHRDTSLTTQTKHTFLHNIPALLVHHAAGRPPKNAHARDRLRV